MKRLRDLRNLVFLFVFFTVLVGVVGFAGKAVKTINNKPIQVKQTNIEVKQIDGKFQEFKLQQKILMF